MAQSFPETAHNKTDPEKYKENFDLIDWSKLKEKPIEKKSVKKHVTAGLCGEYGLSVFDEKAYKENYDNIDWGSETVKEVGILTIINVDTKNNTITCETKEIEK